MRRDWTDYTKTELLKLPHRSWPDDNLIYDWLLIVPSRLKHDSGFARIALIGCLQDEPKEILAMPDDVELPKLVTQTPFLGCRMDCSYPHGVLRIWSNRYKFQVGIPISSVEIIAVKRFEGNNV